MRGAWGRNAVFCLNLLSSYLFFFYVGLKDIGLETFSVVSQYLLDPIENDVRESRPPLDLRLMETTDSGRIHLRHALSPAAAWRGRESAGISISSARNRAAAGRMTRQGEQNTRDTLTISNILFMQCGRGEEFRSRKKRGKKCFGPSWKTGKLSLPLYTMISLFRSFSSHEWFADSTSRMKTSWIICEKRFFKLVKYQLSYHSRIRDWNFHCWLNERALVRLLLRINGYRVDV